jgi:hypothetical protein
VAWRRVVHHPCPRRRVISVGETRTGPGSDTHPGYDAIVIGMTAIHGRVFFAQFHLDTLQSWLATAESVIGIVIEGVFVAMIIQRLFR